jgi:hypothetical protein
MLENLKGKTLGRPRSRLKNNVKIDLSGVGWERVD